ncbi:MAG: DNA polymerase I [Caudoviricetes sp.]|nr:MAG: DNA polymerase I [Caudoviricetes sp.]
MSILVFDTETYDPFLKTRGVGWSINEGHLIAISYVLLNDNLEVIQRDCINTFDEFKPIYNQADLIVGANLIYDLGWIGTIGLDYHNKKLCDIFFMASLLNDEWEISLDGLAYKLLGEKKDYSMYEEAAKICGGRPTDSQRANIYRLPFEVIKKYAQRDADLTAKIYIELIKEIQEQNLTKLLELENKLIPVLIEMKKRGVKIDLDKANDVYKDLEKQQTYLKSKILNYNGGEEFNFFSNLQLKKVFDLNGIPYTYTEKGNPSFSEKSIKEIDHPLIKFLLEYKYLEKIKSTFIQKALIDKQVNGRLHANFHPLRIGKSGTVSGRFSCTNPNLQQIPSKGELGKLVRSIFIPNHENENWVKYDYSQIEYRFLVHFAVGHGVDEIRKQFTDNPDIDYHEIVRKMILDKTGKDISRKLCKNINFGILYGMGGSKLSTTLGVSFEEANGFIMSYHESLPFIRDTCNTASMVCQSRGFARTLLGRRIRLQDKLYTALNRILQGSSADYLKLVIVKAYEQGLFEEIGYPLITVHDELNFSCNYAEHREAFNKLENLMINAFPLKIPLKIDRGIGDNWGELD